MSTVLMMLPTAMAADMPTAARIGDLGARWDITRILLESTWIDFSGPGFQKH
jgi:hypothetical protein